MSSYQDGSSEIESLLTGERVEQQKKKTGLEFAKYIVVFCLAGMVLLVNVSLTGTEKKSSSISDSASITVKVSKPYSSLDDTQKRSLFDKFRHEFHRQYDTDSEEDADKFGTFKTYLDNLDVKNELELRKGGTAVHGITRFADMTHAEFKGRFLGFKSTTDHRKMADEGATPPKRDSSVTSVDWTGTYTTPIKDQGYCGSCWSFSATEQIESDAIRAGVITTSTYLSPEQIVQCDGTSYGCNGGNTETAYAYVEKAGGLLTQQEYPYTSYDGDTGDCTMSTISTSDTRVDISSFSSLSMSTSTATEEAMIDYVLTTGPVSVCLDASEWYSYTSGILASCGDSVDHCVQIVGVDTEAGYWKVRNSWGTEWGEDGFIYLALGSNTCYITYDPTYTTTLVSTNSATKRYV